MIPYTDPEIYQLLENSNCITDIQNIVEYLHERGDNRFHFLLKLYISLYI